MKNVTITLPDELARRARVEAAKAGKSLSRYISDRLAQDLRAAAKNAQAKTLQREALDKFLSGPGWPGISKDLPSREELYAERLFHRHEPAPLRAGSKNSGKSAKGRRAVGGARGP
jgi:hypothetical protein